MKANATKHFDLSVFEYEYGLVALTNNIRSGITLILVGGLGDNLISLLYLQNFIDYCSENRLGLIIPQLRSMPNYRLFSIDEDIENINSLVNSVEDEIVLIGHSTGCQDILLFCEKYKSEKVRGIVLQAPVSDIECQDVDFIEKCRKFYIDKKNYKGKYFIFEDNPWLVERFYSLYLKNGKEDCFSSYLPDSKYVRNVGSTKILSVVSELDEYVKVSIIDKLKILGEFHVLKNGDHSLSCSNVRKEFVKVVHKFIQSIKFLSQTS